MTEAQIQSNLEEVWESMEELFGRKVRDLDMKQWDDKPMDKLLRLLTVFKFVMVMNKTALNLEKMVKATKVQKNIATSRDVNSLWVKLVDNYREADVSMKQMRKLFRLSWIKHNMNDLHDYRFFFTSMARFLTCDGELKLRLSGKPGTRALMSRSNQMTFAKQYQEFTKTENMPDIKAPDAGLLKLIKHLNSQNPLLGNHETKQANNSGATKQAMQGLQTMEMFKRGQYN